MSDSADMRIEQFLRSRAQASGAKIALVDGTTRLGFADLDRFSDGLAAAFAAEGVGGGDRVVLLMRNSWEAVVAVFAAFKVGAAVVPVSGAAKSGKLAAIFNHSGAVGFVTEAAFAPVAACTMAAIPSIRLTVVAGTQGQPVVGGLLRFEDALAGSGWAPGRRGAAEIATILYTTDPAGRLKSVATSHRTLVRSLAAAADLAPAAGGVVLSRLPLSSWPGLHVLLLSVMAGATLVLERPGAFPGSLMEHMAAERVTDLWTSSRMAASLLASDAFNPETLNDLHRIVHISAPPPSVQLLHLGHRFPGAEILGVYGLPECPAALVTPAGPLHASSPGRAAPGIEAVILDRAGAVAAPGLIGELVLRGPQIADSCDPAAGAGPNVREIRTGDFFRADESGLFHFVGRRDDLIKIDGENVDPREIDEVLAALPGVREAVAIGMSDPAIGPAFKAVVVPCDGVRLSEGDVIAHCARHLEERLVPRWVEFRPSLPKTKAGAVNRQLIEEDAREAAE